MSMKRLAILALLIAACGTTSGVGDIADLESRLEGLEETAPDVYEMYSSYLADPRNEAWRDYLTLNR